jgi:hypothetical protein
MFTVSAVLVVLELMELPSPSLPLRVCTISSHFGDIMLTFVIDAKQARDLIGVLRESNQKIDPRLMEMARFGGGGGGGRGRYGGGRGRGGTFWFEIVPFLNNADVCPGHSGYSGGNAAPIRNSRW